MLWLEIILGNKVSRVMIKSHLSLLRHQTPGHCHSLLTCQQPPHPRYPFDHHLQPRAPNLIPVDDANHSPVSFSFVQVRCHGHRPGNHYFD